MSQPEYSVVCLYPEWCHTCDAYLPRFLALAGKFPQAEFRWLDIEDHADEVGEREVENFPTIEIRRGAEVLFYGVLLPKHEHLQRLLEELLGGP